MKKEKNQKKVEKRLDSLADQKIDGTKIAGGLSVSANGRPEIGAHVGVGG